jgi:nitric-oxide synthase
MVEYLDNLWAKAQSFYRDYYLERGLGDPEFRLRQIKAEIDCKGTYWQTTTELEYGAKMAWRNSNRCIGRLFWKSLKVRDLRHINGEQDISEAIVEHLHLANNQGKIRPYISIFRAEQPLLGKSIRLWNSKIVHYAGYEQNGKVIGDPAEIEFTKICQDLGWQGSGSAFDVLPLVIQVNEQKPKLFEIPRKAVLEVALTHPEYAWFAHLDLKWYAVPLIADMVLEIGGLHYTCAPFNGWYMLTEIASRNLGDTQRYNLLPIIAEKLKLDTRSNQHLWKDRAMLELNIAVLHSFKSAGVSLVDHHTAAEQFIRFTEQEEQEGRTVQADWAWIVPPMSGSSMTVFHKEWDNEVLTPNYFYNTPVWKAATKAEISIKTCPFHINSQKEVANLSKEPELS